MKKNSSKTPKILSGDELASLFSEIFSVTDYRIGSILVEANIVLTLAGVRAQTEFFVDNPTTSDQVVIKKLSSFLSSRKILVYLGKIIERCEKPPMLMVSILNIEGLVRSSKLSQIPGVCSFDSAEGSAEVDKWVQETHSQLAIEIEKGNILCNLSDIPDIISGVLRGYPDKAIFDAVEWWGSNQGLSLITNSNIELVTLYGGASPDFLYHPNHVNDPSILKTISEWCLVLRSFYDHPWHQLMRVNPDFINARNANKDC